VILQVGPQNEEEFRSLCENSALGTRMYATYLAYGNETPGVGFWLAPGLCLGQTDDTLTVCGVPGEEQAEELNGFLQMLGVRTVVCAPAAAEKLHLHTLARGEAMVRPGEGEVLPCGGYARAEALQLRRLCGFLQRCETETFRAPEPDGFYLDFSHRVRHLAADGELLLRNGEMAACALAGAVTETDALISAVAVLPEYRRQGLGREAVLALAARLGGRRCHVLRAENENEAFYRALGFVPHGEWVEGTVR
jgi:ribosomal protein S18 acetylase RimI-like enzyme